MKRLTFILVIVGLIFYSEYGYAQEKKMDSFGVH